MRPVLVRCAWCGERLVRVAGPHRCKGCGTVLHRILWEDMTWAERYRAAKALGKTVQQMWGFDPLNMLHPGELKEDSAAFANDFIEQAMEAFAKEMDRKILAELTQGRGPKEMRL